MRLEFSIAVRTQALPWPVAALLVCLGAPLGLTVFLLTVLLAVWTGTDVLLPLGPLLGIALPCLLVFSAGVGTVAWFERAGPRIRLLYLALLLVFTLYETGSAAIFVSNHVMIISVF